MTTFSDFTFPSCNNKTRIHVRRCQPDCQPRGLIQIAHGIAEHVERYDDFAAFFASKGFVVMANDHLGHGQSINSEGDLGYFGENGGWELVVGDMRKLHNIMKREFPGLPIFLFGHSMGSFLSRTYIIHYSSDLDGVILSGTGQQPRSLIKAGLLISSAEIRRHGTRYRSKTIYNMAFGSYNRGFKPARTPSDWLSSDEASVDKYNSDPLCGFIPQIGLFRDMLGGISYIGSDRNVSRTKKDLPIFLISGDRDPVGENGKGVMRVYSSFLRCGMSDVTVKLYHNCRHELTNEKNKSEVYADVLAWINGKL